MIKDDLDDGYYSSYKNNLCKVKFTAKTHIEDIKKYFNENNISIYLFDINHNIINYELNVIKKIKAEFSKDSYIVAVEDEMFQLNEMFKVYNRGENEYLILEENKIDTSVIGSKILQIGVLDLITGNYTTYSTIINIVDNIAPIIIAESKYTILDVNLSVDSFYENINIILSSLRNYISQIMIARLIHSRFQIRIIVAHDHSSHFTGPCICRQLRVNNQ